MSKLWLLRVRIRNVLDARIVGNVGNGNMSNKRSDKSILTISTDYK